MIRRAALQVQITPGQPTTILATGWVLGWTEQNDVMIAYFEDNQHGFVNKIPLDQIQFNDGEPTTVPTLD